MTRKERALEAPDLLLALRRGFARVKDPAKAPQMQAYMKSAMPYLGVTVPLMRSTAKSVFAAHPIETAEAWECCVRAIWRGAKFREERYAAIELACDRRARSFQTMKALPLYETLIVEGAWWDFVDQVATDRLGTLLRNEPRAMKQVLLRWSRDDNIWKRRAAILAQIGFKDKTDTSLLYACIEPSLSSKEFFLQKAIGWALRQYAWTDPAEVVRYVHEHDRELSALSKREALKNVGRVRGRK